MTEKSCGTIPYTVIDGKIRYLLIRSRITGMCSFPKGHTESGESETDTALRETLEETSLRVNINAEVRFEISYTLSNGNIKTVIYFPAQFSDQIPRRNGTFEDYEYMLLPYNEAYASLSYSSLKQILSSTNDILTQKAQKNSLD
jgi:8-oxo-dGTP pyrophosphatase MutT (NUDIX family)